MRASVALVALSLLVLACSSSRGAASDGGSLAQLRHLSPEQQNFGVILDAKSGRALAAFRVDNPIRAAIPDRSGGWYIGGGFVHVNGVLRKRLAHIDASGRLDPHWKPEANGNGVSVTALARLGPRLYVAGDFARLQHRPRFHFGALDVATGRLLPQWRPQPRQPLDGQILLTAGDQVVAGGGSCCSEAGSSVYGLDGRTGAIDPTWKPHVGPTTLTGSGVYLLASGGRGVVIRGLFGRPHGRIAVGEIDPSRRRLARKWRPASKRCLWCTLMAAAVGNDRVFGTVNGSAAYPLESFSRRSGELDRRWRARLSSVTGFYGAASATAVAVAGGRVYVTGDFDRVAGAHRNGFAALDEKHPHVLPSWQPTAGTVYGSLLAPSRDRLLLAIGLSREIRFNFTGLKTFVPIHRLSVTLAVSGAATVRVGLGRHCEYERWTETACCGGTVFRWLDRVNFPRAERRPYDHALPVLPGRYFVRFVPRATGGTPQPPYDFPITIR